MLHLKKDIMVFEYIYASILKRLSLILRNISFIIVDKAQNVVLSFIYHAYFRHKSTRFASLLLFVASRGNRSHNTQHAETKEDATEAVQ